MDLSFFTLIGQNGDAAAAGAAAVFGLMFLLFEIVLIVGTLVGLWVIFTKAGQPGWAAIIPIYNIIVLLNIVGRPVWWIVLFLIPCVNLIISIIVFIDLAKSFGKNEIYGVGLALLGFIFLPLLAFSDARYLGPSVRQA